MVESAEFKDILDIDDCDVSSLTDSIVICNDRMNFSEVTDYFAFVADVCLSARMQISLVAVRCVVDFFLHSGFFEEFFYNALHIKEVSCAVHSKSEVCSLIRKFCQRQCFWQIYFADLIQTNAFVSSVVVCCQRRKHAMQSCCTHDAVVLSKRVADRDRFAKVAILRNAKFVEYFRAFEGVGHSL